MSSAPVMVHFCCPQCLSVYQARQERRAEKRHGAFHCQNCGTRVHEWTGIYDFLDWRHVKKGRAGAARLW
jgi:predicted RNA-binding Zn-ribbon protein involved in translation (DUF1610 family)